MDKKQKSITHITRFGDLKAAADHIGVHRNTIYYWIKQDTDYARAVYRARQRYIASLGDGREISRDQQTGGVHDSDYASRVRPDSVLDVQG